MKTTDFTEPNFQMDGRMAVEYFLSDHLGSTSLTTDSNGNKVSEMRYTAWGEVRYTWTDPNLNTSPIYALTRYTFTGQYSYASDFGLLYYNARWYDSALGRFAQADTIVTGGVQGLDRYAYSNNSPVVYVDPSGHCATDGDDWCFHDHTQAPPPAPTLTPTPVPTPAPITVGAVCGSWPSKMTEQGPNCVQQTDPTDPVIHLEGLDESAPSGYSVIPIRYDGGIPPKPVQKGAIAAAAPQVLICYSAGVDSCLMYAIETNNPIQSIVLIGGAYYAQTGPDTFITKAEFTSAIISLGGKDINILIIYDGNGAGDVDVPSGGNIQHVDISGYEDHLTVDDSSSAIWSHVWAWIQDPTYQLPYTTVR